jgi:putative aldouronate transport system permease protein
MVESGRFIRKNVYRRNLIPHLSLGDVLIYFVLLIVVIVTAYPFFYVFSLSVMPYQNYVRQPVHLGPSGFTLAYYQQILLNPSLMRSFGISILKTIVGTALNVTATLAAAWALSRKELPMGRTIAIFIFIPLYVGGGLIPYFLVINSLGLLNTFWALVIPSFVDPFLLLIARAYFLGFPQELIDAALVDGAGHLKIFMNIVWPTSWPIIATLMTLYGIGHWNSYFWPSILVQSNLHPAIVILQGIVASERAQTALGLNITKQAGAYQSFVAAMTVLLVIPMLAVYPFTQRYLVKGIMLGAVKN